MRGDLSRGAALPPEGQLGMLHLSSTEKCRDRGKAQPGSSAAQGREAGLTLLLGKGARAVQSPGQQQNHPSESTQLINSPHTVLCVCHQELARV